MKDSDVPVMALRRAVQVCDGLDALGDKLNVSSDRLQRMLDGEEALPQPLFTRVVGLLLEATARRLLKGATPDSNEGGRKGPRH